MGYNASGKNLMLDALGAAVGYAGLLNASGTEISGGSPAYARKAVTWNAAATGAMTASNQPAFDVPAVTVGYVALFTALTGGTEHVRDEVTNETFAAQGTYTVTSISLDLNT